MPPARLKPVLEIEHTTPAGILDGLETLEGSSGHGIMLDPPGDGPDRLLNWALQEINSAMHSTTADETAHHCVNAVLNARRALACLVDWYLERDLANLCKNPPVTPKQQVKFLIARGVLDELTSRVMERAIQKRNNVEHRYESPSLEVAEDVVELVRRTSTALRAQFPPEHAPWTFGFFMNSMGWGKNGGTAEFHGWSKPVVVFSRFGPKPWVGLVLPKNETKALIRRALLKETTTEELSQLLMLAGRNFGVPSLYAGAQHSELLASEAGLRYE